MLQLDPSTENARFPRRGLKNENKSFKRAACLLAARREGKPYNDNFPWKMILSDGPSGAHFSVPTHFILKGTYVYHIG